MNLSVEMRGSSEDYNCLRVHHYEQNLYIFMHLMVKKKHYTVFCKIGQNALISAHHFSLICFVDFAMVRYS